METEERVGVGKIGSGANRGPRPEGKFPNDAMMYKGSRGNPKRKLSDVQGGERKQGEKREEVWPGDRGPSTRRVTERREGIQ